MEENMTNETKDILYDENIRLDRLRYEKNRLPSLMCYLSIVFDVLYFILVYKINNGFFYSYIVGLSVIINLFFLLAAFLSSEEIKGYNKKYAYVMIIIGVIQILRIFYYPMKAHAEEIAGSETVTYVMTDLQYVTSIVYLSCSAASMFVGAAFGLTRSLMLENYLKEIKAD